MSATLRNDEAGCTRKDCNRASRCVRYLGALHRKAHAINGLWVWVPDPEKCTEFWEVKNAEKSA